MSFLKAGVIYEKVIVILNFWDISADLDLQSRHHTCCHKFFTHRFKLHLYTTIRFSFGYFPRLHHQEATCFDEGFNKPKQGNLYVCFFDEQ